MSIELVSTHGKMPCCMCGKPVDTRENSAPGVELTDGRWTCSPECWDRATEERPTEAGMPRLEQLRKFVAWEREHSPDTTHIAEWALQEIERLRAPCGGEAVAWGTPLGDTGAWSVTCHPHPGDVARGIWQPLYTAPPSAPAGVEGLQRLTADASQLVERFRDRAEYEDKHVLELAERDGLVVEKYSGSQTGALLRQAADALEAARVDANRYRWLRISADISWNGNCAHSMLFATDEDREALDTAVDAAMADTARGEEGV